MKLDIQFNEGDAVLDFWRQHQWKFPILTSTVQKFYGVPGSNTSVERLFSSSKSTISERRTILGTEKVNELLFLEKNLQVLRKLDTTAASVDKEIQVKRKTIHPWSSSISYHNQEQSRITEVWKKFKMIDSDNNVIYDDDLEEDKENDETDCF